MVSTMIIAPLAIASINLKSPSQPLGLLVGIRVGVDLTQKTGEKTKKPRSKTNAWWKNALDSFKCPNLVSF